MALSPLTPADDWAELILETAKETFNGLITIYRPGTPGTYDPVTDTTVGGTAESIVLGPRAARAQHLRLPQEFNDGTGWDVKRRYRFQFEILDGDPSITKGLYARFSGGRDPELAKVEFQIASATNSSHAALRTVEAVSELARA